MNRKNVVGSVAELKAILGPDFPSQINKVIDHIDGHCPSLDRAVSLCHHRQC